MQDFLPLERPSDVFFYTSFRGSFFEPRLHLSFETASPKSTSMRSNRNGKPTVCDCWNRIAFRARFNWPSVPGRTSALSFLPPAQRAACNMRSGRPGCLSKGSAVRWPFDRLAIIRLPKSRPTSRQIVKERFADPRFAAAMAEYTVVCPEADLTQPSESLSGRYWYNLHVVLVVAERGRVTDGATLAAFRDGSFRIAAKKGHSIARLAAMRDHLHSALRGNVNESPQEIALGFQNNLANLLGQKRIWDDGFYVGTFGEYDFGAIRAAVRKAEAPDVADNLIHLPGKLAGVW